MKLEKISIMHDIWEKFERSSTFRQDLLVHEMFLEVEKKINEIIDHINEKENSISIDK